MIVVGSAFAMLIFLLFIFSLFHVALRYALPLSAAVVAFWIAAIAAISAFTS